MQKSSFAISNVNSFRLEEIIIDKLSVVPVYEQLVQAASDAIIQGHLPQDTPMPSINHLSRDLAISRATVERVYGELKTNRLIVSRHGKGFFVARTTKQPARKVLMLFNQLNSYNKQVFDSFSETLGTQADIDFQVYHNSEAYFRHLLKRRKSYTHFVIMPHFSDEPQKAKDLIDTLPKNRLILLGKNIELSGKYGAVYENFACSIYQSLVQIAGRLRKYQCLNLVHRNRGYFPEEVTKGFTEFCEMHNFCYRIIPEVNAEVIREGEAYLVMPDDQMMHLLREIAELNLETGRDVGVISYNENEAKEFTLNGLTTISTDFTVMEKEAATMVLSGKLSHIENPFSLRLRGSV